MRQPDWPDKSASDDRPLTRQEMQRFKRAVYSVRDAETFEALVAAQPVDFRDDFKRTAFPYLRNSVKIGLRRRARERRAREQSTPPRVH